MKFSAAIAILLLATFAFINCDAQERAADADTLVDATASGLAFLARQQNLDGSFQAGGQKLAVTALGVLAFVENGRTSDGGKYAPSVRRAVELLLRQTPGDRYFGRVDGSRMYGHAIVTLALCRAYGVEPDEQTRARLRATAKDAVAILIAAQNIKKPTEHAGGWGEQRDSADSDPRISAWACDALRAANQIGLDVPKENLARAQAYLQHAAEKPISFATNATFFAADDGYFAARRALRANNADFQRQCARLIAAQAGDGGWPAESSNEALTRARVTSLSLLTFALRLRLSPD